MELSFAASVCCLCSQTALMDQGSVLLCRINWEKSVPCQKVGVVPGVFQLFSLLEGGLPVPAVHRDCSVTCSEVILFHSNHCTHFLR